MTLVQVMQVCSSLKNPHPMAYSGILIIDFQINALLDCINFFTLKDGMKSEFHPLHASCINEDSFIVSSNAIDCFSGRTQGYSS